MAEAKKERAQEEVRCKIIRDCLLETGKTVWKLKESYKGREDAHPGQTGEMIANAMLAYRHLEDARMRVGKIMQQLQGGVSIFDK